MQASKSLLPFPVLFTDKDYIVIDKPAGRPTSSVDGALSVKDILSEVILDQSYGKENAYVVHRLDKEVSGVVIFAKNEEAMEDLKDKWQDTEKHYLAFVEGIPEKPEGTISTWLKEDNRQMVHSTHEQEGAKFAITNYKIIKTIGVNALLDIKTDTGRKNQIRVHLSEMGHPIIGDRRYGASAEFKRRIRLHACSLGFPHPYSGKFIKIESPMPQGFLELKPKDEKYK
jgi:RluA family pseudouridine synthase